MLKNKDEIIGFNIESGRTIRCKVEKVNKSFLWVIWNEKKLKLMRKEVPEYERTFTYPYENTYYFYGTGKIYEIAVKDTGLYHLLSEKYKEIRRITLDGQLKKQIEKLEKEIEEKNLELKKIKDLFEKNQQI